MNFITDKQTLEDLNLTGKYRPGSIFSLFNQVQTSGGEKLLENMFYHPLTDAEMINKRGSVFRFFQEKKVRFPIERTQLDLMENYLGGNGENNLLSAGISNFKKHLSGLFLRDEGYAQLQKGIGATIQVLGSIAKFTALLKTDDDNHPFKAQLATITKILKDSRLKWLKYEEGSSQLSFFKLNRYDYLLKKKMKTELETLIGLIYHIDVYIAVGNIAAERDFVYAKAFPKETNMITAEGLHHPSIKQAVGNNVSFSKEKNALFLTGANMAGKSTLMKTFGISIYLAHMGFPVAAKEMCFSVKDGIYSSINVADNLNMGYSHFYTEVLRVKKVAEEVSRGKELLVMFDELFKGTNVKDAYDATLAVTEAFSAYSQSFFIISTHIIEVGEALESKLDNMCFAFLPTIMDGNIPKYTYRLENGITTDRQGMIIIENEGILKILEEENQGNN